MFEAEKKALENGKCVCAGGSGVEKSRHEGCAVCPNREVVLEDVARSQGENLYRDDHPGDTDEPMDPKYDRKLEEE